jgi:hypothetical protein
MLRTVNVRRLVSSWCQFATMRNTGRLSDAPPPRRQGMSGTMRPKGESRKDFWAPVGAALDGPLTLCGRRRAHRRPCRYRLPRLPAIASWSALSESARHTITGTMHAVTLSSTERFRTARLEYRTCKLIGALKAGATTMGLWRPRRPAKRTRTTKAPTTTARGLVGA